MTSTYTTHPFRIAEGGIKCDDTLPVKASTLLEDLLESGAIKDVEEEGRPRGRRAATVRVTTLRAIVLGRSGGGIRSFSSAEAKSRRDELPPGIVRLDGSEAVKVSQPTAK